MQLDDPAERPWLLVVEPQAELLELLIARLTDALGIDVVGCGDGAEALELIRSAGAPALLLLDVLLPSLDGLNLAKQARDLDGGERMQVVFLTAVPLFRVEDQLGEARPYAYLRKPQRIPDLLDMLRQAYAARAP